MSCAQVTAPLVDPINSNAMEYPREVQQEQKERRQKCYQKNCEKAAEEAEAVKASLTKGQQNAVEQASERGASTWLTAIPMTKYGFQLNKQAFQDALCLRYGWTPEKLPSHCPCGESFSVAHAFSCPKGALPSIRHNRGRNIMHSLPQWWDRAHSLVSVWRELSFEVYLCRGRARLNIKAQNFWDNRKRSAYFDIMYSWLIRQRTAMPPRRRATGDMRGRTGESMRDGF